MDIDLTKSLTQEERQKLREWAVSKKHEENHMSASRAYDKLMYLRASIGAPKLSPNAWRAELDMGGVKDGCIFGYKIPKQKQPIVVQVEVETAAEPADSFQEEQYYPREKLNPLENAIRALECFKRLGRTTGLYEVFQQIMPNKNGGKLADSKYDDLLMELYQLDVVTKSQTPSGKKGRWEYILTDEQLRLWFPQCIPSPEDVRICGIHLQWIKYRHQKNAEKTQQRIQAKKDAEKKAEEEARLKAEAEEEARLKAEAEAKAKIEAEAHKAAAEKEYNERLISFKNLVIQYSVDGVVNSAKLDRITMGKFSQYWLQILLADDFLSEEGHGFCKVYRLK